MVKLEIKEKEKEKNVVVRFGDVVLHCGDLYFACPTSFGDKMMFYSFTSVGRIEVWSSNGIETEFNVIPFNTIKHHFNNDNNLELIPKENIDMTIKVNR